MLSLPEPLREIAWCFAVRDFDAALHSLIDALPGAHDLAEAAYACHRIIQKGRSPAHCPHRGPA